MNVHHLELFYYVARYEGIVAACRHIPYGIQQPAVSAQVASLEADLGVRLFERRPFRLTAAGKRLYEFARPFFGRLGEVAEEVRGFHTDTLRLAGLTEVMRGHVPAILAELRRDFPGLKVGLQEIDQRGAERLIEEDEADIAITVLESKLPQGFRTVVLAELPLCLLVSPETRFHKAADLLKAGAAGEIGLVSLPPHELLPRLFQKELTRRGLVWRTAMETSSQDLVTIYVRSALGAGLAVQTPDLMAAKDIRVLPLAGFPSLAIGAFWRGSLAPVAESFLERIKTRSRSYTSSL